MDNLELETLQLFPRVGMLDTMLKSMDKEKRLRVLGLMSGSSADGLDLCLVEFWNDNDRDHFKVIATHEQSYPDDLHKTFIDPLRLSDDDVSKYDIKLGKWFVITINKYDLSFQAIACHGQTIKHEPPHFSLQIGDPRFMADAFSVPVVYNFRNADIKLGGQGAPLIPIVDKLLLQHESIDRIALNIGGIANLTIIPAKQSDRPVIAWDTGPGNTLMDKAVRTYTNGSLKFDEDGLIAAQGKLYLKLLSYMEQHEFYKHSPPRSAGQEQFGNHYFDQIMDFAHPAGGSDFKDLIYTLTVLTVSTISASIKKLYHMNYTPQELFISGGGSFNLTLVNLLRQELPEIKIFQLDLQGVNASNKEAFGFAYLGYLRLMGRPGNIPSVTGARESVLLGDVCTSS